MLKTGIWFVIAVCLFFGKESGSMEIEEFETIYNENHPIRKEFDIHTEICFKTFKSSLVRLTFLFLDPQNAMREGHEDSKCWIKCMLEKFNFIKIDEGEENGEILPGSIMERASELSETTRTKLQEIFQKCEVDSRVTVNNCDKAFIFVHCVFEMYKGGQNIITVVPVVSQAQPVIVNVKQPVVVPPRRTTVVKRPIVVRPMGPPEKHPPPPPPPHLNQPARAVRG